MERSVIFRKSCGKLVQRMAHDEQAAKRLYRLISCNPALGTSKTGGLTHNRTLFVKALRKQNRSWTRGWEEQSLLTRTTPTS